MIKAQNKKVKILKDEYIAVTQKNKRYKMNSLFSEDLKINNKKADIKIFESEDGFTYLVWKNRKYQAEITDKSQNKYTVLLNGVSYWFSVESPISYKRKKYLEGKKQNRGNNSSYAGQDC
jgi:hypothetical protein